MFVTALSARRSLVHAVLVVAAFELLAASALAQQDSLPPGIADVAPKQARAAPATAKGQPSFDCTNATAPVEKLICGDAGLAALDRTLNDAYTKAMAQWPEAEKTAQRAAQRSWIAARNGCAKASEPKPCVETSYRQRIVAVQITSGALMAPTPVGLVCKGHENEPFTVAYYNQTDSRAAVVTLGNKQTIAFAAPSASGARYTNSEIELWEHQGEVSVKWSGASYTCKAR